MTRPSRTPLTAEFVREILDYDSLTGVFRWRARADRPSRWNTRYAGTVAGSFVKGYLQIQIPKPHNYYCHVLAWLYVHEEWRPGEIDHKDGNRANNRIENLRIATESQNACNKAVQSNNKSGFAGVHFDKQRGKWRACVSIKGDRHDCGFFDTREQAAAARAREARLVHGEFARLKHG